MAPKPDLGSGFQRIYQGLEKAPLLISHWLHPILAIPSDGSVSTQKSRYFGGDKDEPAEIFRMLMAELCLVPTRTGKPGNKARDSAGRQTVLTPTRCG